MGSRTTGERLADAAIAIIARDGLDALSVRRVASEVSMTGGTVQHHFPTKSELTVAALDRCVERQGRRVKGAVDRARAGDETPVGQLVGGLGELLCHDPASRDEAIVWIAMSAAVPTQPAVGARYHSAVVQTRRWIQSSIDRGQRIGEVPRSIDAEHAALMLEAGLDGLMLQGVTDSEGVGAQTPAILDVLVRRLLLAPAQT